MPHRPLIGFFFLVGGVFSYTEIYLVIPLPDLQFPAILRSMVTRQRIRELLREHALTKQQLDDIAAYCDTVQTELTEAQVHKIAEHTEKRG